MKKHEKVLKPNGNLAPWDGHGESCNDGTGERILKRMESGKKGASSDREVLWMVDESAVAVDEDHGRVRREMTSR